MPVTLGLVAAGAQLVGGGLQSAFSGRGAAEKDFESYAKQSPLYRGNPSIDQYYQEALSRYNENPYQSAQYKAAQNASGRTMATGISGLQGRGAAIGGIGRLAAIQNDAMQNAGVRAESNTSQRFGQLGSAAQMKTSEDYRKFDINQLTPYNRNLQVKQMKSQAANERFNAGLNMMGGAVSNAANIGVASAYANPKGLNKTADNTSLVTRTPEPTIASDYQRIFKLPTAPQGELVNKAYNPNSVNASDLGAAPDFGAYWSRKMRR